MSTVGADKPPQEEGIELQSFTHARTHPWVLGKVGQARLPFQLSPTQVAVFMVSFLGLLQTRGLWAHLGGVGNVVVQIVVPVGLAWAVRSLRMEGRSPGRMLLGLCSYLSVPRKGRAQGRPGHEPRANAVCGARVFVLATLPAHPADDYPFGRPSGTVAQR